MTVLIAYGTLEGQTAKIAHFINDVVRETSYETKLINASGHPCCLSQWQLE
ncbi:hypothetical protein [Ruegeria faecimaris]|uniref:hypothetical protein n=1 Tax=Ruegeria faecimaris TaxID=686389 RepID=UPI0024934DC2|nr:hypothetical protein [Ruegeria faecimaris]